MAAKKMGLGKGLDSMIPPKMNQADTSVKEGNVLQTGETVLKINDVEPNKNSHYKP